MILTKKIAKHALTVIVSILFFIIVLFVLCWHYDGFEAAWSLFFGSDTIPSFFYLVGIYDWVKGIVLALLIAGAVEVLCGRRLTKKSARLILDIASGVITLVGYIIFFT